MTTSVGMMLQALLLALGIMLLVALVVGLMVAIRPAMLDRLERTADRRYSMRRATRVLDTPHNIDRYFYRYHRLYGAGVVILAVALLSFLAFGQPEIAWRSLFGPGNRVVGEILVDTARVVLWILGLFALVIGALVFLRPSALKSFEAWANRWLTTRQTLHGVEREFHGAERWIRRHPRGWGLTIALLSALFLLALILQMPAIVRLTG